MKALVGKNGVGGARVHIVSIGHSLIMIGRVSTIIRAFERRDRVKDVHPVSLDFGFTHAGNLRKFLEAMRAGYRNRR